jgi:hypothetical protein
MVAWVKDDKDHPKDTAQSVAGLIKQGYRELLAKAKVIAKQLLEDDAELYPDGCPCDACEAAREIMEVTCRK